MKPVQFARAGLLGALALAISATAWGQEDKVDTRFYVAPMASFGFFDSDVSVKPGSGAANDVEVAPEDDVGLTISVGKVLNQYFNAELYYFNFSGVADDNIAGAESDHHGFGIAGMYFPFRDFIPVYALAGFGFGSYDFSGYNLSDANPDADFFDLGVGFILPVPYIDFGYGARIRAEYRFRQIDVELKNNQDVKFDNGIASIGVVIPIGAPPAVDNDGDGVLSDQDQCLGTPPGTKVDSTGCALPQDDDGDGVPHDQDQCLGTPPGTKVDSTGCPVPVDKDGDGVMPNADQCIGTPAGANVNSTGCQVIVLQGVTFRFNQATLTEQAENRLDKIVNKLKSHTSVEIKIVGYTDSKGSRSYNQQLSEERAQSVMRYLVEHGIDPSRMSAVGRGERNPIAPNTNPDGSDNPAGRAKNRRVEIHITDR